jgi:hypothetical protein
MKTIKIWKCFGNQCITPCVQPYDPNHDVPDGCVWGDGISNFQVEEVTQNEILSHFMDMGEHFTFTQICTKRKGICPGEYDGKCINDDGEKCPEWVRIDK